MYEEKSVIKIFYDNDRGEARSGAFNRKRFHYIVKPLKVDIIKKAVHNHTLQRPKLQLLLFSGLNME